MVNEHSTEQLEVDPRYEEETALIAGILNEIENKFKDGELAYISLTGKNEMFIRDNFSAQLFTKEQLYARECKRMDLANLDTTKNTINADLIIEFKSMYTSDILNDKHFKKDYFPRIIRDFTKNKKYMNENTSVYSLIIATNPCNQIPKKHINYVKYLNGINTYLKPYQPNNHKLLYDCNSNLKKFFKESAFNLMPHSIYAGNAFETDVDLHFWIISPNFCKCEHKSIIDIIEANRTGNSLTDSDSLIYICPTCDAFLKII